MIKKNRKTVGILGGMGPYATQAFFKKIVELTPANKDWDHIRMIIDNNPHIPSRSRCILYNEESPLEGMIESCVKLRNYPVDVIAIPCNSACYFIKEIKAKIDVPILNIMEITANALAEANPNIKKVAVFGGAITYNKETYKEFLLKNNKEYIHHSEGIQKKIESFIEKIKLNSINEELKKEIYELIENMKKNYGAEAIILGCTEFGCIEDIDTSVKLIDSNTELAKFIVNNFS